MSRPDLSQDLIDILAGRQSEEDVAVSHGVPVAEVRRWRGIFADGLSRGTPAPRRSPLRVVALAVAVVGTYAVAQSLVSFSANTPARASDVNANFSALKTWVENKTGPVGGNQVVTDGGMLLSGSAGLTMPTANVAFGTQTRQMLNLSGTACGVGVQASTVYQRSADSFAWFKGGTHDDAALAPGTGGTLTMRLDSAGNLTTTGTIVRSGYQVACAAGENGYHYGFCCRMNVRTGAAECRNGTDVSFTAWAAPQALFAAGTEGHYSLSCMGHRAYANFPVCCRTGNSGTTECKVSTGLALSWSNAASPW